MLGTYWENRIQDNCYLEIVRKKVESGSKLISSMHVNFAKCGKPEWEMPFAVSVERGASRAFRKRGLGQHANSKPCVVCGRLTQNHDATVDEDGVEQEEYCHETCRLKAVREGTLDNG